MLALHSLALPGERKKNGILYLFLPFNNRDRARKMVCRLL